MSIPVVDSVLSYAHQNNDDQPQDKLWSVVKEGCEVLGHYRLLQRPLIVSDEVGNSEEKGDNWIEEEESQWVDKQLPPDQPENIFSLLQQHRFTQKFYIY